MWETSFDKHTDHIKNGPATIAMDTAFLGSKHLYGIPEHATTFVLKNTDGTDGGYDEPYRLWNLDVFEFDLDVPMALYGAVPLIVSHSATHTNAVLWLNAAETYVDISDYDAQSKQTHWISETGNLDVFLFPGPTPAAVFEQYTTLTGTPALPQEFAVAYHQCRWNYKNEDDVSAVDNGFDDHDIPYDVLWLDIEHTNDKMYFTWDKNNFPTPQKMQNALSEKGRKMVTIVDPHIKRKDSYHIHKQAKNKFYVTDKEGKDFDGWCWPGSSSYLDFIRPDVRGFWAEQFSLANYEGSTPSLYTWNDMNEPSVFNGPEVTMPKDCLHDNGLVEHREVHNQYGFYQQMATEKGQADRGGRPFVLSRSFFAGSQRYGAIWTGDNMATWEHHESTVPMLLALGTGGIVFSGADVGGFFGDPDAELLTRWYQAAAFQPFFRGHAHIDTKRREPWVFGEHYTSIIRDAIRRRYAMMPYVYTTFQQASVSGFPVMRALWHEFPALESTFAVEDEFLLGGALLVKPVTQAGQKTTTVQLPLDATTDVWYDYTTYAPVTQASVDVDVSDLSTLVAYYRGGYIVPLKLRPRRASALMANDPYTLVIALNGAQEASGTLYLDDGASYDYLAQKHTTLKFQFTDNTLSSSVAGVAGYDDGCSIERLIVLGLKKDVTAVTQANGQTLQFTQDGTVLTVKKPGVGTSAPFSISFA
jgi:alpha 1,3-glucosidase